MARKATDKASSAVKLAVVPKAAVPDAVSENPSPLSKFDVTMRCYEALPLSGHFSPLPFTRSPKERSEQALRFLLLMMEFLTSLESKNSDIVRGDAEMLRDLLETMDEQDRKKTIAGLMAYIGELQTAGLLEATPSDRLARVAKLIGEAAEIVSADPAKYVPLFGDRPIDPATGKKPTALEWFDQVWKPRVDAGEVHGADMKRTDPSFYSTLSSTLSRKNQKLTDLLPPSPTGRPRNPGPTDARLEHARELNRKRAARWRAAKRNPK